MPTRENPTEKMHRTKIKYITTNQIRIDHHRTMSHLTPPLSPHATLARATNSSALSAYTASYMCLNLLHFKAMHIQKINNRPQKYTPKKDCALRKSE